jgi:hypothetical protein
LADSAGSGARLVSLASAGGDEQEVNEPRAERGGGEHYGGALERGQRARARGVAEDRDEDGNAEDDADLPGHRDDA